jgi:hypothetical protein
MFKAERILVWLCFEVKQIGELAILLLTSTEQVIKWGCNIPIRLVASQDFVFRSQGTLEVLSSAKSREPLFSTLAVNL